MILAFTPNPAFDETYIAPRLQLDASHRVSLQHRQAGGKGVNVAKVLHSQGIPVRALCPLGGDTGELFATQLRGENVQLVQVPVSAATRRSMAFHDAQANITSVFNESGQPLSAAEWQGVEEEFARLLPEAQAVVVCGSWPTGTDFSRMQSLVNRATSQGIWTLVDTSGPNLLRAAECAAVLKPNEHELREATGCSTLAQGARLLLERGAAEVFVSAGAAGIYHFTKNNERIAHAKLARTLQGNPTGAGDSAVAALAAGIVRGLDREQTLRLAVAWSAATVLMPMAGKLSPEHLGLLNESEYRLVDSAHMI